MDQLATKKLYGKIMLRMIPYIFVCYLFNYLDRVNVGFAKLKMLDDIGMSEAAYGLGAGIFFIGYLAFGLPSNLAIQKFGAKRWLAIIMILWGALSSSLMFVHSANSFYILRFFTGAAEAGFFPGLVLYFTYWFPNSVRGRVMTLFMSAIPLSGVVGGPLSGWILDTFTLNPVWGLAPWQWLFIIEGVPTILLGVGIYFILDDNVDKAKWLTQEQKDKIRADLAEDEKNKPAVQSDSMADVLKNKVVWLFGLVYFACQTGTYAINFWLPTVIKAGNWGDMTAIGWISAIPYFAASIFMIFMGRSADKHNERRWHLAIPMLMGFIGLTVCASFSSSPVIALIGLVIATMGFLSSLALFWPLSSNFLSVSAAACGLAIINSIGQIAGFVSPYFVGWIKDATQSTDIAWYCISLLALVGVAVMLSISKTKKVNE